MKFKGTKLSKRTVALLAAAIMLFSTGGIMGVLAEPALTSQDYDATIATNSIEVQLTEDGQDVENGGEIFTKLDGKVEPGYTYKDAIGVRNSGKAEEFVRVIVRKYWVAPETDEPTEESASGKAMELSPDLIELGLTGDWTENTKEFTNYPETSVYYLNSVLPVGGTATLFNTIRVNESIANIRETDEQTTVDAEGTKKTIITYKYTYNGYTFYVEAEAQSVQTHHPNDAIKSVWGVQNVTASGTSLKVN